MVEGRVVNQCLESGVGVGVGVQGGGQKSDGSTASLNPEDLGGRGPSPERQETHCKHGAQRPQKL